MKPISKVAKYLGNVGKSAGYVAVDKIKDRAPATSDFVQSNAEIFKTVYSTVYTFRAGINRNYKTFKQSKLYGAVDAGMQNVKHDIMNGTFYDPKLAASRDTTALASEDSSDDFNFGDENDGFGDMDLSFGDESGEMSESEMQLENQKNISASNAQAISTAISGTGQAIIDNQRVSTNIFFTQMSQINKELNGNLNAINQNIGNMLSFSQDIVKVHVENSTKYYSEMTNMMKQQLELLQNIHNKMIPATGKDDKKSRTRYGDIVSGNGAVNLKAYASVIKKNAMNSTGMLGTVTGMLGGMGALGGDGNVLQMMVSSPFKFAVEKAVDAIVPKLVGDTIEQFDKSFKGFFGSLMLKMNSLAEHGTDELSRTIGEVLGIRTNRTSNIDTKKYNKDRMEWNGKANKALVEVIPHQLSEVISLLSGTERKIFDYDSGKFRTMSSVKKGFEDSKNRYARSATSDMEEHIISRASKTKFNSKKEFDTFKKDVNEFLTKAFETQTFINPNDKKSWEKLTNSKHGKAIVSMMSSAGNEKLFDMNTKFLEEMNNRGAAIEKMAENNDNVLNAIYNELSDKKKDTERQTNQTKNVARSEIGLNAKDEFGRTGFYYLRNIYTELVDANAGGGRIGGVGSRRTSKYGSYKQYLDNRPSEISDLKRDFSISYDSEGNYKYVDKDFNAKTAKEKKYNSAREIKDNEKFLADQAKRLKTVHKSAIVDMSSLYGEDKDIGKVKNLDEWLKAEEKAAKLKKKKDGMLDKLAKADSLSGKYKVFAQQLNNLSKKPLEMFTSTIKKVDQRMYQVLYGTKEGKGKDAGFVQALVQQTKETFQKLNNFIDDKILTPLRDKLGLNSLKDIPYKLAKSLGFDLREVKNKILSPVKKTLKSAGKHLSHGYDVVTDTISAPFKKAKEKYDAKHAKNEYENNVDDLYESFSTEHMGSPVKPKGPKIKRGPYTGHTATKGEADDRFNNTNTYRDKKKLNELQGKYKENDAKLQSALNNHRQAKARLEEVKRLEVHSPEGQAKKEKLIKEAKKIYELRHKSVMKLNTENIKLAKLMAPIAKRLNHYATIRQNIGEHLHGMDVGKLKDGAQRELLHDLTMGAMGSVNVGNAENLSAKELDSLLENEVNGKGGKRYASAERIRKGLNKKYSEYEIDLEHGSSLKSVRDTIKKTDTTVNSKTSMFNEEITNYEQYLKTNSEYSRETSSGIGKLTSQMETYQHNMQMLGLKLSQGVEHIIHIISNNSNNRRGRRAAYKGKDYSGLSKSYEEILDLSHSDTVGTPGEEAVIQNKFAELRKAFDTSIAGLFKSTPRHAEGGTIKDDHLAVVGKGEVIIPAEEAKQLKGLVEQLYSSVTGDDKEGAKGHIKAIAKHMSEKEYTKDHIAKLVDSANVHKDSKGKITDAIHNASVALNGGIDLDTATPSLTKDAKEIGSEMKSTILSAADKFSEATFGLNPGAVKKKSSEYVNTIFKDASQSIPDMAGAGLITGVGLPILTAGLLGPLGAFAVGAGASLVKNSEAAQKALFGTIGEDGKSRGGLLGGKSLDFFRKAMPDMKKGAIFGALTGLMPFVPVIGPIGGLMLGSGVAMAKNSESFMESLFGPADERKRKKLLENSFMKRVKKSAPSMAIGAAGMALLGPFGLLGNAAMGAGLGLLGTSNRFQDFILGKKDDATGKYENGLLPSIRDKVITPMSDSFKNLASKMGTFIKNDILIPIKEAVKPILSMFTGMGKDAFMKVGGWFNGMFEGIFKISFSDLVRQKFIDPLLNSFNKVKDMMLGGIKKVILSPIKLLSFLGKKAQASNIKKGRATGTTSKERLKFRQENRVDSKRDHMFTLDQNLSDMSEDELQDLKKDYITYNTSKEDLRKQQRESISNISDSIVNGSVTQGMSLRKRDAMLKTIQQTRSMDKALGMAGIDTKIRGNDDFAKVTERTMKHIAKHKGSQGESLKNTNNILNQLLAGEDHAELRERLKAKAKAGKDLSEEDMRLIDTKLGGQDSKSIRDAFLSNTASKRTTENTTNAFMKLVSENGKYDLNAGTNALDKIREAVESGDSRKLAAFINIINDHKVKANISDSDMGNVDTHVANQNKHAKDKEDFRELLSKSNIDNKDIMDKIEKAYFKGDHAGLKEIIDTDLKGLIDNNSHKFTGENLKAISEYANEHQAKDIKNQGAAKRSNKELQHILKNANFTTAQKARAKDLFKHGQFDLLREMLSNSKGSLDSRLNNTSQLLDYGSELSSYDEKKSNFTANEAIIKDRFKALGWDLDRNNMGNKGISYIDSEIKDRQKNKAVDLEEENNKNVSDIKTEAERLADLNQKAQEATTVYRKSLITQIGSSVHLLVDAIKGGHLTDAEREAHTVNAYGGTFNKAKQKDKNDALEKEVNNLLGNDEYTDSVNKSVHDNKVKGRRQTGRHVKVNTVRRVSNAIDNIKTTAILTDIGINKFGMPTIGDHRAKQAKKREKLNTNTAKKNAMRLQSHLTGIRDANDEKNLKKEKELAKQVAEGSSVNIETHAMGGHIHQDMISTLSKGEHVLSQDQYNTVMASLQHLYGSLGHTPPPVSSKPSLLSRASSVYKSAKGTSNYITDKAYTKVGEFGHKIVELDRRGGQKAQELIGKTLDKSSEIYGNAKDKAGKAYGKVKQGAEYVGDKIGTGYNKIKDGASYIGEKVGGVYNKGKDWIDKKLEPVKNIMNNILHPVEFLKGKLKGVFGKIMAPLKKLKDKGVEFIKNKLKNHKENKKFKKIYKAIKTIRNIAGQSAHTLTQILHHLKLSGRGLTGGAGSSNMHHLFGGVHIGLKNRGAKTNIKGAEVKQPNSLMEKIGAKFGIMPIEKDDKRGFANHKALAKAGIGAPRMLENGDDPHSTKVEQTDDGPIKYVIDNKGDWVPDRNDATTLATLKKQKKQGKFESSLLGAVEGLKGKVGGKEVKEGKKKESFLDKLFGGGGLLKGILDKVLIGGAIIAFLPVIMKYVLPWLIKMIPSMLKGGGKLLSNLTSDMYQATTGQEKSEQKKTTNENMARIALGATRKNKVLDNLGKKGIEKMTGVGTRDASKAAEYGNKVAAKAMAKGATKEAAEEIGKEAAAKYMTKGTVKATAYNIIRHPFKSTRRAITGAVGKTATTSREVINNRGPIGKLSEMAGGKLDSLVDKMNNKAGVARTAWMKDGVQATLEDGTKIYKDKASKTAYKLVNNKRVYINPETGKELTKRNAMKAAEAAASNKGGFFQKMSSKVGEESLGGKFFKGLDGLMHPIKSAKSGAKKVFGFATDNAKKGLQFVGKETGLTDKFTHLKDSITSPIKSGFDTVKNAVGKGANAVKSSIGKTVDAAKDGASKLGAKISKAMGGDALQNATKKADTATKLLDSGSRSANEAAGKEAAEEMAKNGTKSGFYGKVINMIKAAADKLLNNKVVRGMLSSSVAEKMAAEFIPEFLKVAGSRLLKAGAKVLAKISAVVVSGGTMTIAFGVYDFLSGYDDAANILQIAAKPTWVQRITAGIIKSLTGLVTWGLIPAQLIVTVVTKHLFPALGVKLTDYDKQRKDAQGTVEAYNKKHRTKYSLAEYNDKENKSFIGKGVNWVANKLSWLGNEIKSSSIGKKLGGWWTDVKQSKVGKAVGGVASGLWNGGKAVVNTIGSIGSGILSSIGSLFSGGSGSNDAVYGRAYPTKREIHRYKIDMNGKGNGGTGFSGGSGSNDAVYGRAFPTKQEANSSQTTSTIKNIKFGNSTIGKTGCGPVAASMAVNMATGNSMADPISAAKLAEQNGYANTNGTNEGFFNNYGNKFGVNFQKTNDISAIKSSIGTGNPVVFGGMGDTYGTKNPHYLVGSSIEGSNNIAVKNPRDGVTRIVPLRRLLDQTQTAMISNKENNHGLAVTEQQFNKQFRGADGQTPPTTSDKPASNDKDVVQRGQGSANLVYFMKGAEGLSYKQYRDSGGVLTIGYGSTGDTAKNNTSVTEAQATQFTVNEVAQKSSELKNFLIKQKMTNVTQGEYDAMLDFSYNAGVGGFSQSDAWKAIKSGKHGQALADIWSYSWIHDNSGQRSEGLVNRRKREVAMFLGQPLPGYSSAPNINIYGTNKRLQDNHYYGTAVDLPVNPLAGSVPTGSVGPDGASAGADGGATGDNKSESIWQKLTNVFSTIGNTFLGIPTPSDTTGADSENPDGSQGDNGTAGDTSGSTSDAATKFFTTSIPNCKETSPVQASRTINGETRPHYGIDFAAPLGSKIKSPIDGTVKYNTTQGPKTGFGNYLVIEDEDGYENWFGHLQKQSNLKVGSKVKTNQYIANLGDTGRSTGPHLHYEIRKNQGGGTADRYYPNDYLADYYKYEQGKPASPNAFKPKRIPHPNDSKGGQGGGLEPFASVSTDNTLFKQMLAALLKIAVNTNSIHKIVEILTGRVAETGDTSQNLATAAKVAQVTTLSDKAMEKINESMEMGNDQQAQYIFEALSALAKQ